MTHNNRAAAHRMLKARQDRGPHDDKPDKPPPAGTPPGSPSGPPEITPPPLTSLSPTPPPTSPSTPPPPPPSPSTSPPPASSPPPTSTPPAPSASSPSSTPASSTSTDTISKSSTSDSASSSGVSTLSPSLGSTSATTTSTKAPLNTGVTIINGLSTTGNTRFVTRPSSTVDSGTTVSAGPTGPAASSGIGTGAIVGSVAGAIAGIAIIALIVAFFLRRFRRRRRYEGDADFNPSEFVRTPPLDSEFHDSPSGSPPYRASTFDPHPPTMTERGGHNVSPSVSGAGMAGHGAYAVGAGLQERPQYTYGQQTHDARDDDGSEIAHGGAYSSEPQPQNVYNPEAYGSYAYSTEGAYAVTQQAYHPYQAQEYHAYSDNTAPALVAGAPAVAAGRGAGSSSRAPHPDNDDDAYGGI